MKKIFVAMSVLAIVLAGALPSQAASGHGGGGHGGGMQHGAGHFEGHHFDGHHFDGRHFDGHGHFRFGPVFPYYAYPRRITPA